MFRSWYFYTLGPVFIVMAVTVLLVIPYLAVIALLGVVILALYGFIRAVVAVSHSVSHAVGRHRPQLHAAAPSAATVLAPVRRPTV